MAAAKKLTSAAGFEYKLNNFTAYLETTPGNSDFHDIMKFLKQCRLSYAMTAAPTIYCEIVDEMWTTAVYNEGSKTITLKIKNNEYVINSETVRNALHLPVNNCAARPNDENLTDMLEAIHYSAEINLGNISRAHLRKEWSFFFDSITKAVSYTHLTLPTIYSV